MLSTKNLLSLPDENHLPPVNHAMCAGTVVSIAENGQLLVTFPENPFGPLAARFINFQFPENLKTGKTDIPVLLTFESNNLKKPIIIGCLHDTYSAAVNNQDPNISTWQDKDVYIDGEKIVIHAKEEIILKCGNSSLSLRKDGKILLKGAKVTSRASDTNKIKGSSVNIN